MSDPAAAVQAPTTLTLDAAFAMAMTHQAAGRLPSAQQIYNGILQVAPDHPRALYWLGAIALRQDHHAVAEQHLRAVLRQLPNNIDALTGLCVALFELGQLAEAERVARRAVQIDAAYAPAYRCLGRILLHQSRHAEAVASYGRAVALAPKDASLMTELLYCMVQDEATDSQHLARMHRDFGKKFGANLRDPQRGHSNPRDPDRRLRVGFISGDLRQHAVAYFIEPVWRELDRGKIELFAYANLLLEDATSQRLKQLVDHWRPVISLDDAQLAEQVRRDGIDILIDLSGHTALNRLLVFARKPAPLQASWIGYPETTGLTAMDYHLANTHSAPVGVVDALFVEKLVRLDACGAFEADAAAGDVNALPALQRGYFTFGSFNRMSKLGATVVDTWGRVLLQVPTARLLVADVGDPDVERNLRQRFAALGVAAERLSLVPRQPLAAYFRLHHEVDVLLDSFPYTGGTTTQNALWMGVPVVTLAGMRRTERISTGVLSRVGLEDWSVTSIDAYVARAVAAANDIANLAELRAGLRGRIASSPLRQTSTAARSLEVAFRTMWKRWCAGLPAEAFRVTLEQALQRPGV